MALQSYFLAIPDIHKNVLDFFLKNRYNEKQALYLRTGQFSLGGANMNFAKKITAFLLTAMLCISLTSCGDDGVAAEFDGQEIPAGVYILQQVMALNEAQQSENYDSSLEDIWDNTIEDKSLEEWVNEKALEYLKNYVAVEQWFDEEGLTLSEEDLESIDYTVESTWPNYEDSYNDIGIAESSYELYQTNQYKYNLLFQKYYGEDGTEPITDDDLMEYYQTDFAQFQMISFSTLDPSTYEAMDDAEKEEVKEKAESYLQRAQDGEDMVTLINERAKEYAEERGQEEPEIDETQTYVRTIKKDTSSYYVSDDVRDAIFSQAEIGEPILLSDDNGYYVIKRQEVSPTEDDFEELKESLLYDLKGEDFQDIVTQRGKEVSVSLHDDSIKDYKATKLSKLFETN